MPYTCLTGILHYFPKDILMLKAKKNGPTQMFCVTTKVPITSAQYSNLKLDLKKIQITTITTITTNLLPLDGTCDIVTFLLLNLRGNKCKYCV